MIADVVLTAAADPPEGVPPWVTYLVSGILGSPFVVALGWVLVRAIAKRLGVQADTQQGNPETSPATPTGPEQSGQEAPAERYDSKMALLSRMVEQQDERLDQLEARNHTLVNENGQLRTDLAEARAAADWNRRLLDQLMGRQAEGPQGPPPAPPPPQFGPSAPSRGRWPES